MNTYTLPGLTFVRTRDAGYASRNMRKAECIECNKPATCAVFHNGEKYSGGAYKTEDHWLHTDGTPGHNGRDTIDLKPKYEDRGCRGCGSPKAATVTDNGYRNLYECPDCGHTVTVRHGE